KKLRTQAGLTQRELAEKVNVDFTYLSKIENGVLPPPSEKVILQLDEVLSADKDELMTLAGKIPADIAEILKNRAAMQLLRSDNARQKARATREKKTMAMSKLATPIKKLSRIAVPIMLVVAVALSLWFAAPTQALEISFPSLPSGTLGSTHSANVKITITGAEHIPAHSINMVFYSVSDGTKTATLSNLPLVSATKNYTSAQTGNGGAVTVTATPGYGWIYGSSGTGYVDWKGGDL
ncbi:helix-turn-helix domain-containing protein, partial [Chloroflexota bacterium]